MVLEGSDHLPFYGEVDDLFDEIEEFFTGRRPTAATDGVFAVLLFA